MVGVNVKAPSVGMPGIDFSNTLLRLPGWRAKVSEIHDSHRHTAHDIRSKKLRGSMPSGVLGVISLTPEEPEQISAEPVIPALIVTDPLADPFDVTNIIEEHRAAVETAFFRDAKKDNRNGAALSAALFAPQSPYGKTPAQQDVERAFEIKLASGTGGGLRTSKWARYFEIHRPIFDRYMRDPTFLRQHIFGGETFSPTGNNVSLSQADIPILGALLIVRNFLFMNHLQLRNTSAILTMLLKAQVPIEKAALVPTTNGEMAVRIQLENGESVYLGKDLHLLPASEISIYSQSDTYSDDTAPLRDVGTELALEGRTEMAAAVFSLAVGLEVRNTNPLHALEMMSSDYLGDAARARNKAAVAFYDLGNRNYERHELAAAIDAYTRALVIRPKFAEALRAWGYILNDVGDLKGAIAKYREALAIHPDDPDTLLALGRALEESNDTKGADTTLTKAAVAYYNLGNEYFGVGDLDKSAANFRYALAIRPKFAKAHLALGIILEEKHELDDAATAYHSAYLADPNLETAIGRLATAARKKTAAQMHYISGLGLYASGNIPQAIVSFRKALAIYPHYAKALHGLGMAFHSSGHVNEAIVAYRRALEFHREGPEIHNDLGQALLDWGDADGAKAQFEEALRIDPQDEAARENLSQFFH